jgi:hypothetical protein
MAIIPRKEDLAKSDYKPEMKCKSSIILHCTCLNYTKYTNLAKKFSILWNIYYVSCHKGQSYLSDDGWGMLVQACLQLQNLCENSKACCCFIHPLFY